MTQQSHGMAKRRLRSPIRWYGGKGNMVGRILKYLPPHEQYCEPFFGGGSVFFAKEPAKVETINDINKAVMDFFRVLRDHPDEFIRLAKLTEYSEALWRECKETWQDEKDPVRRAWKWWVVARQSFAGRWGRGWGYSRTVSIRGRPTDVNNFRVAVDNLERVAERLQNVQIMCRDYREAMAACDTPDCLHYLDPPYPLEIRVEPAAGYQHEMSLSDHEVLAEFLLSEVKGMVVLSGQPHPVYEPLEEAGWRRIDIPTASWAAGRTRSTGILGPGSALREQPRIESLWISPNAWEKLEEARGQRLFDI